VSSEAHASSANSRPRIMRYGSAPMPTSCDGTQPHIRKRLEASSGTEALRHKANKGSGPRQASITVRPRPASNHTRGLTHPAARRTPPTTTTPPNQMSTRDGRQESAAKGVGGARLFPRLQTTRGKPGTQPHPPKDWRAPIAPALPACGAGKLTSLICQDPPYSASTADNGRRGRTQDGGRSTAQTRTPSPDGFDVGGRQKRPKAHTTTGRRRELFLPRLIARATKHL